MALEDKIQWSSSTDLHFSSDGKHNFNFTEDFPFSLNYIDFSTGVHLTPSYHDYLEIVYTYDGMGVIRTAGKDYTAKGGDIFVIDNTEFHSFESSGDQSLRIVAIYFMPELIYQPGCSSIDFEFLLPFFDHSVEFLHKPQLTKATKERVFNLIQLIRQELDEKKDYYRIAVKTHLCEVLTYLVRYYKGLSVDVGHYNKKRKEIDRLSHVFIFLREHFEEKVQLSTVAKISCMSPSYFCRSFKKVTGRSLTDYVRRLRIDKAKQLLVNSDLPVTSVGLEVGFDNHSYFDRTFKHYCYLSPKEFRRRFVHSPD